MPQPSFSIEFFYNDIPYLGFVRPIGKSSASGFSVILNSGNQEFYLEILLKPGSYAFGEWIFECGEGEDAAHYYEQGLLDELGDQVQAQLNSHEVAVAGNSFA